MPAARPQPEPRVGTCRLTPAEGSRAGRMAGASPAPRWLRVRCSSARLGPRHDRPARDPRPWHPTRPAKPPPAPRSPRRGSVPLAAPGRRGGRRSPPSHWSTLPPPCPPACSIRGARARGRCRRDHRYRIPAPPCRCACACLPQSNSRRHALVSLASRVMPLSVPMCRILPACIRRISLVRRSVPLPTIEYLPASPHPPFR